MTKVEVRHKRTGEVKIFAEPVWAMLEKGGHARRNWDFVRRYSVEVPAEVSAMAVQKNFFPATGLSVEWTHEQNESGDQTIKLGRVLSADGNELQFLGDHANSGGGILAFAKEKSKKRRSKTPKQI